MAQPVGISTLCPYCGMNASSGGGFSRDHVFVKALGGRATVACCRACNSRIGAEVEGPLQAADGFLNLAAAAAGRGKPVPGRFEGRAVTYDLNSKELRLNQPVEVTRHRDVVRYRYEGSPRQVRELLKQRGLSKSDIDRHIASAARVDLGTHMIEVDLTMMLPLEDRLAAKVGLGAGLLAFGPKFLASALAIGLRDLLWGRAMVETRLALPALEATDELFAEARQMGATDLPQIEPTTGQSQALLLPTPKGTAVVVHLAGHPLSMSGRVLPHPMPGGSGLPVLVRDGKGGADVHVLANLLADRTSRGT